MPSKTIILLLGPIILLTLLVISLTNSPLFSTIIKEDNIIEYSQFFILMITSLIAFRISYKLSISKHHTLAVLYLLASIFLFFVAGEEVSWGQRLFKVETPEFYADINVQEETTIHNLYFIHYKIGYGYMIIGLFGALSWLLLKLIKVKLPWISPPWFLTIFFLSGFVYNFSGNFIPINKIWSWAEISELMLQLGIFFFFIDRLLATNKLKIKT